MVIRTAVQHQITEGTVTILVALPVAIMATTVSLHSEHTAKKIVCSFVYHFTRIRLCHASFSLYANLLSDVSCFLSNFFYANQILILFLSAIKLCCRDLATRPFIATNSCILADLLYLPFLSIVATRVYQSLSHVISQSQCGCWVRGLCR